MRKTYVNFGSVEWLLRPRAGALERTVILDAGCGTGNYSQAMLGYVGRIEAVDLNPGMLEVASRKLAQARDEERISFHSGAIDDLPFKDATFGACGKSKMFGEYCPIQGMH